MKRIHIHVGVERIDQAVGFYSALFGAGPVKAKEDYAKWLLDDPPVNFAISTRSGRVGVDHLGVQVDDDAELAELRERIAAADLQAFHEGETVCCYARSDKSWVQDPAGIAWEAYRTMADAQLYSGPMPGTATADRGAQTAKAPAQRENAATGGGCC